jgi:hypothetical protein
MCVVVRNTNRLLVRFRDQPVLTAVGREPLPCNLDRWRKYKLTMDLLFGKYWLAFVTGMLHNKASWNSG